MQLMVTRVPVLVYKDIEKQRKDCHHLQQV